MNHSDMPRLQAHIPADCTLEDYWRAPGGGPLHAAWQNKPHRLLYDLVGEIQRLREQIVQLEHGSINLPQNNG